MKLKLLFISLFFVSFQSLNAQNQKALEKLKKNMTPIEKGNVNLLLLDSEGSRRFFVEKENNIFELLPDNYKETLYKITSDKDLNTLDVNYNLKSLSSIIRTYNTFKNKNPQESSLGARFGFWGGLNNFVQYPSIQGGNENNLFLGAELEAYGKNKFHRHATVFQLRKSIPGDVVDLDLTELMISYRFNLISQQKIIFYLELELVNFSYYNLTYTESSSQEDSFPLIYEDSGRLDLGTPLGLGAGMAIQLTKGVYLTLGYSNIVQLNKTRDDFPLDFRTGIKFNL